VIYTQLTDSGSISSHLTSTWNTWKANKFNAVSLIPDGIEVHMMVLNTQTGLLKERFFFTDVQRLGCHKPTGDFSEIEFNIEGLILYCQFASHLSQFVWSILPQDGHDHLKIGVEISTLGTSQSKVDWQDHQVYVSFGESLNRFSFIGKMVSPPRHTSKSTRVWFESTAPIIILCNQSFSYSEATSYLARRKDEYESTTTAGGGVLSSTITKMINLAAWKIVDTSAVSQVNLIDNAHHNQAYAWDMAFACLALAVQDPTSAWYGLRSILQTTQVEISPAQPGYLSGFAREPLYSYLVLKLFQQTGDVHHLDKCFPVLCQRDHNWGNSFDLRISKTIKNARQPEDECFQITGSHSMIDVVLYTSELWALARIAELLKKPATAKALNQKYQFLVAYINQRYWHPETRKYHDHNSREGSAQFSLNHYLPLFAGIPTKTQAQQMLNDFNPEFQEGETYRLFLIAEGLKRYGSYDLSYRFARRYLDHLINQPEKAQPNQGFLSFLAVSEWIEAQPWDGVRIGNLSGEEASLERFSIQKRLISVKTNCATLVWVNNQLFIRSQAPLLITSGQFTRTRFKCRLQNKQSGLLTFYPGTGIRQVEIVVQDQRYTISLSSQPVSIYIP